MKRFALETSVFKNVVIAAASLLIAFTGISAVASAATDTAAAGVQQTPSPVSQGGTNTGDGGCYNNFNAQNYNNTPDANFKISASLNGRPLTVFADGRILTATVNYKDTLTVTETANRAIDYFINKKGEHVRSISYVKTGPEIVSNPAYCLDEYPQVNRNWTYTFTTPQSVTVDVLGSSSDRDNARSELRITNIQRQNGCTATLVPLGNGRNGVKVGPTGTQTPGYTLTCYIYVTVADPLGKTGWAQITAIYNW